VVVLDLDDFSDDCTCEAEVAALNEYFDSFRINMFAITGLTSESTIKRLSESGCAFYPHGFVHNFLEMDEMTYEKVIENLETADMYRSKGIFGGVFKAPYWRYSSESYNALSDKGYVIAISREQFNPPPLPFRVYEYDLELDEPWERFEGQVLRLHGHCTPYRNSLDLWFEKLMYVLPRDTVFLTVDEYLVMCNEQKREENTP
jgi:peptidoglycan/xylan/chitin deacetylase (PgdA/CDA1 family)